MSMTQSIQPSRQRFARFNANLHQKKKLLHAHLSKELRAKLGVSRRSMLLRKGDKVRLRNGDDKGKTGAVMEVNYADVTIYIEGIATKNARGIDKMRAIQPSNVEIIDGDFTKKDRAAILARGKKKVGGSKTNSLSNASKPSAVSAPAAAKPTTPIAQSQISKPASSAQATSPVKA
jgi:large subunit ribosomal protein L24